MILRLQKLSDWLIWLTPLILFCFVSRNIFYLTIYALFGIAIFFYKKYNIHNTVFLLLLLSLPFERSLRSWVQIIVPDIGDKFNPGYQIYFSITLKLIFAILLFLILMFNTSKYSRLKNRNNQLTLYLIYFFIAACFSSLFAFRQDLATNGIIRLWTSVWIFIACRIFLTDNKIKKHFKKFLISISILFGLIGAMQFLKHAPLGLYLESYSSVDPLGFVTTDGYELYRVSGLMNHPTYFASFLSLLFPVSLGAFIQSLTRTKKISFTKITSGLGTVLTFFSIIATFSRSAWITLVISIILITFKVKDIINWKGIVKSKLVTTFLFCFIAILIINSDGLVQRVITLKGVWIDGTGTGRIELMRQSFTMAQNNPFTGVGFNSFTQALIDQGLNQEYRGFLYPVHNTFLLFFAELGIPAGILFFIFETQIILKTHNRVKNNIYNYCIWVGVLTFLVNSQFHTLFSQDPSFDLFLALVAFLSLI